MSPEQQQLLEKAQRSLEAAQRLMQDGFYDFAVSRAYYAMFYVAEALLDQAGLAFSSHAAVISAFGTAICQNGFAACDVSRLKKRIAICMASHCPMTMYDMDVMRNPKP